MEMEVEVVVEEEVEKVEVEEVARRNVLRP